MMKQFTIKDLKIGYLVRLRNGDLRMVMPVSLLKSPEKDLLILVSNSERWCPLNGYSEDLTSKCASSEGALDIIAVYGYSAQAINVLNLNTFYRPLLWERKKTKEMTIKDIEKILGYPIKVVKESEEKQI